MRFAKRSLIFAGTLMLCATLFAIPLSTSAQTVNIPDAKLRLVIAKALSKAPDARITASDMAKLTHLDANNKGIETLTGLEFATDLEVIVCKNNAISDLSPLSKLIRLRLISFSRNSISDLSPLSGLMNVDSLDLNHNLIEDLSPLKSLTNLRTLHISGNAIVDLSPLAGLINLSNIAISDNPPADLSPLTGLVNLTEFFSWATPILNFSALAKLPKLRVIDICGGKISDISSLADSTNLKELYLVGGSISDISPLVGLTDLTRLALQGNDISDVSPLAELTKLKWVDLSHNSITDISPLAELIENIPILYNDNPAFPAGGRKIEGPWLWVLVPGSRIGDTDLLAAASSGAVTERKIATAGASIGKLVGDEVWAADKIAPVGFNNIGDMLGTRGRGDFVIYGSITLESPREQETRMFVAHRDGLEVWLNGEIIYQKPRGSWGKDYHIFFPVTLAAGTNVLLVALDNDHNDWQGLFGFALGTAYTVNPPISRNAANIPPYDVNQDGHVNILDLILVGQDLGKTKSANARTDVNGDGKRNILDLNVVARHLGEITGIPKAAPSLVSIDTQVSPAMIRAWIAASHAENDGSLAFQLGIANLQQLLTSLIPEETLLLSNYPNPFNPETWIPYQLAETSDVQICIYAVNGTLVRTLDVAHQSAGIYQQRNRAAYWDGRNQLGEPVASGVYFYTLTAGDFTATRKMLIRK